jgi:cell division protein FtsI (penicillin-binding protein 3)
LGNRLVDYAELAEIKKFPILKLGANRGGLITEQKYRRNNPYGRLAYRTIGFINTVGVGVGIEGSCDYYLKGTPGHQVVHRMLGGEWIPVNGAESMLPKDGYDIQTTIDIDIQEVAEKALKEQLSKSENNIEGATALVMEVSTGAIRAIANMKRNGKGGFDESYNYAIGDATEPGSVFKLVTLVSLLEDGHVTLQTPVDAGNGAWKHGGHTYTDTHPIGLVTVQKAFEQSSNVAFAKLAVKYYEGKESEFIDRLTNMKVGERFNLDISGEGRAVIHSPDEAIWSGPTLASMGIGYATLLTPLHTLTFYNAIANDGRMMKPYFIENYQQDGQIIKEFKPIEISGAICSKNTAREARRALRHVVEEGTAKALDNKHYKIAGKTGTSRMAFTGGGYERGGKRMYQASFAGMFPYENPRYTAIVVLYSSPMFGNFYGGSKAGPVFKKIADHIYANSSDWAPIMDGKQNGNKNNPNVNGGRNDEAKTALNTLGIKYIGAESTTGWSEFKTDSTSVKARTIYPTEDSLVNVVNMGLRDAVYLLENQGYKVSFNGYGKVIGQDPAAGSKIDKNSTVTLILQHNGN